MKEFLNELSNTIKKFILKDGTEIVPKKVKLTYETYSIFFNKKSIKVYADGVNIPINKTKVVYQCKCGKINTILLKKFLGKKRIKCPSCREDEEKRRNHSRYFVEGYQKKIIKEKKIVYDFSKESNDFKEKYYKRHLTASEFYLLLPHIKSINGINVQNSNVIYVEHEVIYNQYKYMPHVIINNINVPFTNVELICEKCKKHFSISDRRSKKEKLLKDEILCKDCSFNNKRYQIKMYKTIFGDTIKYQSETEFIFIKKCEKNKIRILNGFDIKYHFNESEHIYKVDFFLPEHKFLIEIKGNHIWHRKQIETGKWNAKENAAVNYAKINDLHFKLLFLNEFNDFFTQLK